MSYRPALHQQYRKRSAQPSIEFVERIATFFDLTLVDFFHKVESGEYSTKTTSNISILNQPSQEGFAKFMETQKLSERTIKKYSLDVPNSVNVKNIIYSVTGMTDDLYHVSSRETLETIIERVADGEFDRVGQRMYSCGIKKYRDYLDYIK